MKFVRDQRAEAGMRNLGIEFTVQTVPMRDINRDLSGTHQARVGKKVNDDWIMEYAVAAQNGAEFPMVILDRLKKDCYFIWSGNHRIGAAELHGDKEIQAYVVHVTDMRLQDILPRVVNTWEGHRESREAVLTHAVYLCEKHNLESKEVATMMGLKPEWVVNALRSSDLRRQVEETGVKIDLPTTGLLKLGPLAGNKNVLKAALKLMKDHNVAVSGDQGVHIIQDVRSKPTERDQLAEVARWNELLKKRTERPAAAKKVPLTLAKRRRAIMVLQNLDKFLAGVTAYTQLQLDDADAQLVADLWSSIYTKMNALLTKKGGGA